MCGGAEVSGCSPLIGPATTKEAERAVETVYDGMPMGKSGIDWEDWRRVRCLLLSNI